MWATRSRLNQAIAGLSRRLPGRSAGEAQALGEPSALFAGIRRRLTLRYSIVLAVILVAFSAVLYFSVRQSLLGPVNDNLHAEVNSVRSGWSRFGVLTVCPDFPGPGLDQSLYECFDGHGDAVAQSRLVLDFAPPFSNPSVAAAAYHNGSASDTIYSGSTFGQVERYAQRITAPDGTFLGVVVFGQQVGPQLDALHNLLVALIVLCAAALILTTAAGFYLADRSLRPARIAQDLQRSFIADASHELRTPLTLLRADAEVLLRGRARLSEEDSTLLEDMVTETSHMAKLADNMLSLARLDARNGHIEREIVDLSALASEVARRARALAEERGIAIRSDAPEKAVVLGDPLLLEQAALILVDNALKYNRPQGEVVLRTSRAGSQVSFEVFDTGIGIDARHLARLGERFYRVDKARSREMGGTGLGIAIARSIAARHGGSLDLVSEPDQGTTARLALPAA